MKTDTRIDARMKRILGLGEATGALGLLIHRLEYSKGEIKTALNNARKVHGVTLGTNSAAAAVTTIDTAVKRLRRELGNVRRAMASSRPRARKVA